MVVDALDDVVPPDGEVLLADVSFVDEVELDDVPGVADIDEPELPVDVTDVDVSAASANVAPVNPIVETINAEASLPLRRSFICAP